MASITPHGVNLWEAIGDAQRLLHDEAKDSTHAKRDEEELRWAKRQLDRNAALGSQEISLRAVFHGGTVGGQIVQEDGWVIVVHSPEESGLVEVFVPRKASEPVAVVTDTRSESARYDDE